MFEFVYNYILEKYEKHDIIVSEMVANCLFYDTEHQSCLRLHFDAECPLGCTHLYFADPELLTKIDQVFHV